MASRSLEELVASFAVQTDEARTRRVALLGIREPASWQLRLLDWLEPKRPDIAHLETRLAHVLGTSFRVETAPATRSPALLSALDELYAFESERSLSASAIANVIVAVGTDSVFVARLVRPGSVVADVACGDAGIRRRLRGVRYVGLDVSPTFVRALATLSHGREEDFERVGTTIDAAMFASAPPTDAGRRSPT